MNEDGLKKYRLTPEEYEVCLKQAEVIVFSKGNAVRGKKPKSIFVIAQPGAGKTGLKAHIVNEGQDNGSLEYFIEFNPDEIAIYHKYYKEILEEYPDDSYQILQEFVRPALDNYLRQRAVELKNNIIQEGTFASTDGYISIIDFQKNGGVARIGKTQLDGVKEEKLVTGDYEIEIDVLAVDKFESYLSALEREQYYRESGLPPRVVTLKNHDYAYEKILDTLKIVEQRGLFDTCRVYKRGYSFIKPELVHVSNDGRYSSVIEALISERNRNRREILRNPQEYYERIENLRKRIEECGIPEQIERLDELKVLFDLEVAKDKEKQTKKE